MFCFVSYGTFSLCLPGENQTFNSLFKDLSRCKSILHLLLVSKVSVTIVILFFFSYRLSSLLVYPSNLQPLSSYLILIYLRTFQTLNFRSDSHLPTLRLLTVLLRDSVVPRDIWRSTWRGPFISLVLKMKVTYSSTKSPSVLRLLFY